MMQFCPAQGNSNCRLFVKRHRVKLTNRSLNWGILIVAEREN